MRADNIKRVITKVNLKYGAPMGRPSVGIKPTNEKIYDKAVHFIDGAYDKEGAYWGAPANLRVQWNKDLTYINFYRTS